jgi:adenylate cyclase class 2
MLEREIKLPYPSAAAARDALLAAGATPLRARRLQDDALLDTADELLRRRSCALRVRSDGGKSIVTFKGPIQPGMMKLREELETVVGDGEVMRHIFAELGFHVWFRYQKYREEYAAEDVVIAVDETPVGVFVEMEGGEQAILTMAAAVGRTPADFILDSYRSLFLQRQREFAIEGRDMVFAAE